MSTATKHHDYRADLRLAPPTLEDIEDAARALTGVAVETPLLESAAVNETLGARLLVKAEMAQRTGAFKFRGAYNRIRQLSEAERRRGVIAYSSGNHAQAVAAAARLMDTRAVIVMPSDAPSSKTARTRDLGAEVITFDRAQETREEVAERIAAERGLVMVPPSEDARVLAGAGTVPLELIRQAGAIDAAPDAILVPCGGGGLTAVTALVAQAQSPSPEVYGVEPELFDDTRRSLEAGELVANPKGRTTICDAIMTTMPCKLTFSINRRLLSGVLTVSDDQVRAAMTFAFDQFKVVVEPGAAVGLAAVLSKKIDIAGKTIAVIATGGNINSESFCQALHAASSSH